MNVSEGRAWGVVPYGAISLLDMLKPYASHFVLLSRLLIELEETIGAPAKAGRTGLFEDEAEALKSFFQARKPAIPAVLGEMPFPSVRAQVNRIISLLKGVWTPQEFHAAVVELKNRLEDELAVQMFIHVPAEMARLYEDQSPFGDEVALSFRTARDNIEDAAKCLALGQGTAAVFHLVGVLEIGLRALAAPLGIPYAPSWESYIKQIKSKIDEKHSSKSRKWKKDEPFFRDVLGDLTSIKTAWRNPTIHVKRRYSPAEAEEVFRTVRTFMQRLAPTLADEGGKRLRKMLD